LFILKDFFFFAFFIHALWLFFLLPDIFEDKCIRHQERRKKHVI
jgi:hypothetical protein